MKNKKILIKIYELFDRIEITKNKKVLIGIILLLILGGFYFSQSKKKSECLDKINYSSSSDSYRIWVREGVSLGGKRFKTKDDAMEYCMSKI